MNLGDQKYNKKVWPNLQHVNLGELNSLKVLGDHFCLQNPRDGNVV